MLVVFPKTHNMGQAAQYVTIPAIESAVLIGLQKFSIVRTAMTTNVIVGASVLSIAPKQYKHSTAKANPPTNEKNFFILFRIPVFGFKADQEDNLLPPCGCFKLYFEDLSLRINDIIADPVEEECRYTFLG